MRITQGQDHARAFPISDAQQHRRNAVTNERRLPYQERIRLKKIAQRGKRREKIEEERSFVIATLNVGTMTGRGREVVDVMERRRIDVLCVQETRWKGQKARELGEGYKLYYMGVDNRRNGVGIVLSPEMKERVIQVSRECDRLIWLKIDLGVAAVNVVCVYAPQVGCTDEEKDEFWDLLCEVTRKIPYEEVLWIAGDLNGHIGGKSLDEGVIGRYEVGTRNEGGDRIVDFAIARSMAVVNTYFQKRLTRRVTYTSGEQRTQVDYIMCRRNDLKQVTDCFVLPKEAVAKQHKLVVCKVRMQQPKKVKPTVAKKTRWWKLNEKEYREKFVQEVEAKLRGETKRTWRTLSTVVRETGRNVLGRTSGKKGKNRETWWWCAEVQEAVKEKRERKKEKDLNRYEETIAAYKQANKKTKIEVAKAKSKAYENLYNSLSEKDGQRKAIRIAKQKNKEAQDIYQAKRVMESGGQILTGEAQIRERWKEYYQQLMNVENPRVKREMEEAEEREVDRVKEDEVAAAMKRMKNGKSVGPDDIPAEAWKVMGRTAVEWLTEVFRNIMGTEHMPDEWRASTLIPIFKNKGDIQDCGNYRGIKLTSHTLKLWERIVDQRLRSTVEISEQQFGFMPNRSTTDAIFALRQLVEKYREGQKNLHCIFIDLEKAYDRVPRQEVWNCLRLKEVEEKYIRIIQDMYKDSKTLVRCAAGDTDEFEVTVGLHQGSALSPFLFAVVMDCMTREVQREAPWDMLFADDVVVCSETKEEVEQRLEMWREAMEVRGMRVSRQKTEYLKLRAGDRQDEGTVTMQGEVVKQVEEFKYLGSTIQADGGIDKEIAKRIQAGWGAWKRITGVMCDRKVSGTVKGQLYKTMVRPAMMYGIETLAVTKAQERKIQVAEMKMLRWSLGFTRKDKIRNDEIRKIMEVGDITDKMQETRLRWLGHVVRRGDEYVGKRIRGMQVGRKKRGRPRRRWEDCVKEDMKERGISESEAWDRGEWRRKIRTGDPN